MNKILILFMFIMAICQSAVSQNCKYDHNEKDPFTGQQTAYIYIKSINDFSNVDASVSIHNDSVYLFFNVTYGQIFQENTLDSGGVLLLKFGNDSIIKLNIFPGRLTVSNMNNVLSSTFSFGVYLNKSDISYLSSNGATVFRVESRNAKWTYNVKENKGKKIQQAVNCIKILQKQ